MGSFYTPGLDYSLYTYLDNLPVYTNGEGQDALLDLAREIIHSGKYYFLGVPFPGTSDAQLAPRAQFSGNITIPPGSYLINVTADSVDAAGQDQRGGNGRQAAGFTVRIYDKGGRIDTFINSQTGKNFPTFGLMDDEPVSGTAGLIGPYWLQSPMVVVEPGSLQIEVTNLDTGPDDSIVQVFLSFVVPVNRQSSNEVLVGTARRFI